jgi:hypothetical protein
LPWLVTPYGGKTLFVGASEDLKIKAKLLCDYCSEYGSDYEPTNQDYESTENPAPQLRASGKDFRIKTLR